MSIQKVTRTKRDGKKVVKWRAFLPPEPDGKRVSKMFDTKAAAVQWKAEQIVQQSPSHNHIPKTDTNMLFSELVELWQEHHVSKRAGSTQQRYSEIFRLYVLPAFGDLVACEITPYQVERWLHQLKNSDLGVKSCNMALTLLKGVFYWAIRTHRLLVNPATAVEPLPVVEEDSFNYWNRSEIDQFLVAVQLDHYYPLYIAALNTGMRLGELVGLQWDAVDLKHRVIRVVRTWCNKEQRLKNTTKGKKARSINISDDLYRVLAEQRLRSTSAWVFTDPEGERIDSIHFTQHIFRKTCRDVQVREIRFHDLRHTYASHFVMNGGDLYVLQKLLGHHSITVTEMYAHLAPDYLRDASGIISFGVSKGPSSEQNGKVIHLKQN